jgi:spore coat polysaccharide biosynthesis protein SpsF
MEINTLLITQARTGSTRLPGKILLEVDNTPLLKIHLERLSKSKNVDKIIVATTVNFEDDIIEKCCTEWGYEVFRGSENDVLDRFFQAAKCFTPEWVVRVTSDCPLIDAELVDAVTLLTKVNDVDYCSNVLIENFPDGQDVEVFKFSALEKAWEYSTLKSEREHVTPYIVENSNFKHRTLFTAINFPCFANFSNVRMTVDEPRDFELIQRVVYDLGIMQNWITYTNHIIKRGLIKINSDIKRNEGHLISLKND